MRISHKHKFVFIAVPRTASTTCRRVLNEYSEIKSVDFSETSDSYPFYHHITAKELKKIFEEKGWNWNEYKKFCLVRNPFDRVVSLYHFTLEGKGKKMTLSSKLLRYLKSLYKPNPNFSKFVSNLNVKNKMQAPITNYITDYDGTILVDNVILYENLRDELPLFLLELGIKIDINNIPIINSSKKRDEYRKYYTSEKLIDKVRKFYDYEIDRFSYKF